MSAPTDPTGLPDARLDRLFNLLPPVIRASDAYAGRPLQALLRVAAEQLNAVDDDVARLLDNWFVETCDPWVLPYLAELLGSEPNPGIPVPSADDSPRGRLRSQAATPRRAVARLVRSRRRKGVLLQLQELALDLTGWPSRAVEFRPLITAAASARFPESGGARTVDLRAGGRLDRANGPFTDLTRRPDVRRLESARTPGRGSLSAVGLFVWRLRVNTIQAGEARGAPAPHHGSHHGDYRLDRYHLDPFGRDLPLYTLAAPLPDPTRPAGETKVPDPIRPRALHVHPARYYGRDKSLFLWRTPRLGPADPRPPAPPATDDDPSIVPPADITVHDLEHWEDSLPPDHLAVDPKSCWLGAVIDPTRGRVLYRRKKRDEGLLWARYHTAFPADIGGGGYTRVIPAAPADATTWTVGGPAPAPSTPPVWFPTLGAALEQWANTKTAPRRVVIEIQDDATHMIGGHHTPLREVNINSGEYLEVRAAPNRRPVVCHHRGDDDPELTFISGGTQDAPGGAFALDGVALADTALRLEGAFGEVQIRNATLAADPDCPGALALQTFSGCLSVASCVIRGAIHVRPEVANEVCDRVTHLSAPANPYPYPPPLARVTIADSVLKGSADEERASKTGTVGEVIALAGRPRATGRDTDPADVTRGHPPGHVALTVLRVTVFGDVTVHALDLAEDSVFAGGLRVTDTSRGCVRFCSLRSDEPRTPPRHACQPDLSLEALQRANPTATPAAAAAAAAGVSPRFTSTSFGDPAFAQLARDCAPQVSRGASDESEMGAFHDLYAPYRETLLAAGLADSAPADADAAIQFVN
ncbi:MAG TPA: hypothetical protein VH092_22350 [Urbifossiella sp.]|nr:hypothetical protein [Urbifossiella sp.]